MAEIYKSKFTGEEIEQILDKANTSTDVVANNGEATTDELTSLKVGDINYSVPEYIYVEANSYAITPSSVLETVTVGNTNYKVIRVYANKVFSADNVLRTIEIDGVDYEITKVVANDGSSTPTAYLRTIRVGDEIYSIPEGVTIEANNDEATTVDLYSLKVGETNYAIPIGVVVVANNGEEATAVLTTLKVGDVNYSIPQGGASVEANNGEETTENLNTLKVDNVNYKIEKGSKVVPNASYTTAADLTTVSIDGVVYKIPVITVIANDEEGFVVTDTLERLTVGSVTYAVPQGTEVEANSEGDATETLSKIKIGDVIYSLPSGGANPLNATSDDEMNALLVADNVGKVAQFNGTSDTYVDGGYYLIERVVQTIQFSIAFSLALGTVTFQAEEGMTWGEWIESAYNNDDTLAFTATTTNIAIVYNTGSYGYRISGVGTDDVIIDGTTYTAGYQGGGASN